MAQATEEQYSEEKEHISRIDQDRLINRLKDLCYLYGPSKLELAVYVYLKQVYKEFVIKCGEKSSSKYQNASFQPAGNSVYQMHQAAPDALGNVFDSHLEWIDLSKGLLPFDGDAPNILIRIKGSKQGDPMVISAHMDTVPLPKNDHRSLVLEDGRLYSNDESILGADDRAGVAAALEMLDIAIEHPELHSGLEVLFTVQEELGCLGSRTLKKDQIISKIGFNLDGETPPGTAIIQAPAKARYTCTVHGKSAHAALAPDQGIHAIVVAADIIKELPQGQVDGDSTANIGLISGGTQTNIIPESAAFTGEVRSFSNTRFHGLCHDIEEICKKVSAEHGASCTLSWENTYQNYHLNPHGPCAAKFSEACRRLHISPKFHSSAGGGDSNNLNSLGIENLVFGLGMHNIHTPDEYLLVDEFIKAVEILEEALFNSD